MARSSDKKTYRTVMGIVQFEPRESEAGGKDVRNVVIRNAGFKENASQVSLTLWPSHDSVEVSEGDVVIADGVYTQRSVDQDDGAPKVYHNLSVSSIAVLGKAEKGERVGTVNTDDEETADDEIPY